MTAFVLRCLVSAGLYLMYTFLPESMPVLHVSDETRFTTTSVFMMAERILSSDFNIFTIESIFSPP